MPATVRAHPVTLVVLGVLVAVIAGTAAGGVWALWPQPAADAVGRLPADAQHADTYRAVVQAVRLGCDAPDPATGGGIGGGGGDDAGLVADGACETVTARLAAGPEQGSVQQVQVSRAQLSTGLGVGEEVVLSRLPAAGGQPTAYVWTDYSRERPLGILVVAFVAAVVLVARLRGVTALAGLVLGYLTISEFMLPALRAGRDPLQVALAGSACILVVILYVAHGVSAKTTTALLGTLSALGASAALAWWASGAAHLDGRGSEDSLSLTRLPGQGLAGVVLVGLVLASLGVLNDVTVTQASAVWEVATHAPGLGVRGLLVSGMRVGRDHLASAVYTIAFAYAGTALPTLMLVDVFSTPWRQVLTSGQVAEEVARTAIGAFGLVLAVPFTTLLAAVVVGIGTRPAGQVVEGGQGGQRSPVVARSTGAVSRT